MGKGSYVLLIRLTEPEILKIGRRRFIPFSSGFYAYVGSALGGFKVRLNRHLKGSKKPHWHIDYLLQKASIGSIILCETNERVECAIAQALGTRFSSVPGFGNSDCRCPSHLFFASEGNQMEAAIMATLKQLEMRPIALNPEDWRG